MKQTFTLVFGGLFVIFSVFFANAEGAGILPDSRRPVYHRVKPTENIFRLSLKYHLKINQLKVWNNLSDVAAIRVGQVLLVANGPALPVGTMPAFTPDSAANIPLAAAAILPDQEILQPDIKPAVTSARFLSGATRVRAGYSPTIAGMLPLPAYPQRLDHKTIAIAILVVLFCLLAIGLFLFVLSSRIYKIYCSFLTNRLRKKYELLLMDVLFKEEADPQTTTRNIAAHFRKNYLQRSFNRRVLLHEIIHLHKNFSGGFAQNLEMFYVSLGFHQDSYDKLSSPLWHKKAQGISELAEMNIKTSIPAITRFIEHPNELLRMEAQLALLKLADEDVLAYLGQLQSLLTDWQQLNLQQVLSHKDRHQIPEFSRWLTSNNESVIEFSVKMIGLYNQVSAITQLIKLLRNANFKIKKATVQALQKLDAADAWPELQAIYHWETNKELRLLIIQALENIGFAEVAFYEKEISSDDFDISLAAAKALLAFKEAGSEYIIQLRQRADHRLNAILAHALDTRI